MFERFTDAAKEAVRTGQVEALQLKHGFVGTEHLLLGVLAVDTAAASLLVELGLSLAAARSEVRQRMADHERLTAKDALATLGIDLNEVKQRAEAVFGEGSLALPEDHPAFTPKAKKALENSLRAALELTSDEIAPEHILLGLLRDESSGVAYQIVNARANGGASGVVEAVEAQISAAVRDELPELESETVVHGGLAMRYILHGVRGLPPGDWASELRRDASKGAAIFIDAREGDEELTRWVDAAKGLAAGLGLRAFPLGSQIYVLHPPDKRVTPDVRREILGRFAVS